MSEEVRAAVKRWRSVDISYIPVYPGGQKQFDLDAQELAKAYLSDHPADSEGPITEEWLRSVGFGQSLEEDTLWIRGRLLAQGSDKFGFAFMYRCGEQVNLPDIYKTRGQLRRLCAALGLELKGSQP